LRDSEIEAETKRAVARLPTLRIEIIHRRSADAGAEQISINLQALPSFEAFGRFLEMTNPLAFWAQAMQLVWLPWLGAASGPTFPAGPPVAPRLVPTRSDAVDREP
jgi:hypothetical protein